MNSTYGENVRQRLSISPAPAWVTVRPVDTTFRPEVPGHQTIFLSDSQHHAEKRQQYRRIVCRLETLDAVQQMSQYKLDFDPASDEIAVHSICVARGEQRVEQAELSRFRFLQREESLEGFIINGWTTLLLLLEDVQVGDVIDISYTVTTTPKLLAERFQLFEGMPFGVPIKALHIEVFFNKARPMRWKSSLKEFKPEVREAGEEISWGWQRENLADAFPEPNLPPWFVVGEWIQVTDCQGWEDVVNACLGKWPLAAGRTELQEVARRLIENGQTQEAQAENAIAFVQDAFRYLSLNVTFGGLIPSSPEEVLRRRFGDCKDLSCLLAGLLGAMGIAARPVLVHTNLTKRVRDLLPMMFFNHAIVEYEIGNERRWVDAVRKLQGGGTRNRPVNDFGFGLPLIEGGRELCPIPAQAKESGVIKLKESFWLSTAKIWSVLEVSVVATGTQAEGLRNLFAHKPECLIAEEREQFYAQFFPKVKRLGKMTRKDNRALNEFTLSETYEIAGALRPTGAGDTVYFGYASHMVQQVLRQPLSDGRKHPCALPFPCSVEHVVEIDFPSLNIQAMPVLYKRHPLFVLSRKTRVGYGFFTATYGIETLGDAILPEQFEAFKQTIDEVWPETTLFITLPSGVAGRRPKHAR